MSFNYNVLKVICRSRTFSYIYFTEHEILGHMNFEFRIPPLRFLLFKFYEKRKVYIKLWFYSCTKLRQIDEGFQRSRRHKTVKPQAVPISAVTQAGGLSKGRTRAACKPGAKIRRWAAICSSYFCSSSLTSRTASTNTKNAIGTVSHKIQVLNITRQGCSFGNNPLN